MYKHHIVNKTMDRYRHCLQAPKFRSEPLRIAYTVFFQYRRFT